MTLTEEEARELDRLEAEVEKAWVVYSDARWLLQKLRRERARKFAKLFAIEEVET